MSISHIFEQSKHYREIKSLAEQHGWTQGNKGFYLVEFIKKYEVGFVTLKFKWGKVNDDLFQVILEHPHKKLTKYDHCNLFALSIFFKNPIYRIQPNQWPIEIEQTVKGEMTFTAQYRGLSIDHVFFNTDIGMSIKAECDGFSKVGIVNPGANMTTCIKRMSQVIYYEKIEKK